jgi:hypothetical protein
MNNSSIDVNNPVDRYFYREDKLKSNSIKVKNNKKNDKLVEKICRDMDKLFPKVPGILYKKANTKITSSIYWCYIKLTNYPTFKRLTIHNKILNYLNEKNPDPFIIYSVQKTQVGIKFLWYSLYHHKNREGIEIRAKYKSPTKEMVIRRYLPDKLRDVIPIILKYSEVNWIFLNR